jgi:hypothetical protein
MKLFSSQANHSFSPDSRYLLFFHPRFGHIPAIQATQVRQLFRPLKAREILRPLRSGSYTGHSGQGDSQAIPVREILRPLRPGKYSGHSGQGDSQTWPFRSGSYSGHSGQEDSQAIQVREILRPLRSGKNSGHSGQGDSQTTQVREVFLPLWSGGFSPLRSGFALIRGIISRDFIFLFFLKISLCYAW